MENFWPVNLLSEHDSGDADWSLFEAQAAAISDATRGLVQGELRRHVMPIGRASSIFIWPTGQRVKGYEFMAIRAEQEGFPLVLEVYHLGDSHRISRARDAAELKRALHKIFDNDATRRIVRLLANEASQAQAVRIDVDRAEVEQPEAEAASGTATPTSRTDDSASRPIAVGGLIHREGESYAQVNLLGIASFLSEQELRKVVVKPDARGSAVSSMNGRFVVTVKFMDSVKFTLSEDELKILKNEVQRVLTGAAGH
jgi:hypothetical protein